MTNRHRAREVAFQILYRYDLALQSPATESFVLAKELSEHFEHFEVAQDLREFASALVEGTLAEISAIDALLTKYAKNWRLSRMSLVDRNLLRMAAFELQHFKDIPVSVTLDEAIELGKQFGTAETPSFLNGLLDSLARELRPGEVGSAPPPPTPEE